MNELQIKQLQRAKEHAIARGGLCLSDDYKNNRTKLLWQCSAGHEPWLAAADKVLFGRWCPKCANQKNSERCIKKDAIQLAQAHALSKGGKCLSTVYVNANEKLTWHCSCADHQSWQATYAKVVLTGRWCPACANIEIAAKQVDKAGLDKAVAHATSKGGKCLSTQYINYNTKLTWQCKAGHEPWQATFGSVVGADSWCPECGKRHLSEDRTRLVFEEFFGKAFPSQKPSWNINPWTSKLLELDGYCQEFNIAFEYDGDHHFSIARYGQSKRPKHTFIYQQFRDEQKRKNCRRQGITLINVPFLSGKKANTFDSFLENIISACKHHDLSIQFQPQELSKLKTKFYTI
ncbi:hypothetical protein [Serratia marcescens]|uniref:hypothetical protein n=1 Tax=Serratia marcescens TaxID=615 RepID=UPI001F149D4C|nr:hypothetical protein [Serratia marcescens]